MPKQIALTYVLVGFLVFNVFVFNAALQTCQPPDATLSHFALQEKTV